MQSFDDIRPILERCLAIQVIGATYAFNEVRRMLAHGGLDLLDLNSEDLDAVLEWFAQIAGATTEANQVELIKAGRCPICGDFNCEDGEPEVAEFHADGSILIPFRCLVCKAEGHQVLRPVSIEFTKDPTDLTAKGGTRG